MSAIVYRDRRKAAARASRPIHLENVSNLDDFQRTAASVQCQKAGFVNIPITPVCQPSFAPGTGFVAGACVSASTDGRRVERVSAFVLRDFDAPDFAVFAGVPFDLSGVLGGRALRTATCADAGLPNRRSSATGAVVLDFSRSAAAPSVDDAWSSENLALSASAARRVSSVATLALETPTPAVGGINCGSVGLSCRTCSEPAAGTLRMQAAKRTSRA